MTEFKPGDRIAYSAHFCQSIGALAGDIPHMRATVDSVQQLGQNRLVSFTQDDGEANKAIASNLAIVGPNIDFCNC